MAAGSLSIPVALFLNHPICCLTLSAVIKQLSSTFGIYSRDRFLLLSVG